MEAIPKKQNKKQTRKKWQQIWEIKYLTEVKSQILKIDLNNARVRVIQISGDVISKGNIRKESWRWVKIVQNSWFSECILGQKYLIAA